MNVDADGHNFINQNSGYFENVEANNDDDHELAQHNSEDPNDNGYVLDVAYDNSLENNGTNQHTEEGEEISVKEKFEKEA